MNSLSRIVGSAVFVASGVFAATLLAPADARACGGEWYPMMQVDPRIQGTDKAEDALDEGKTLAAAGSVIRMIPHIRQLDVTKTKIVQRASRVLALATVRYDGALPLSLEVPYYAQGTWLGRTDAQRRANLDWATKTLRAIASARHDDPAARTELAEGLARVDATRGEARGILEELAKKDLITSPDGYAVLATLRERDGDAEGRRAALDRCKAMSPNAAACRADTRAS
ncbi:MAG TPA: hypothetical protein VH062_11260 [Polyangiaceae bacterium]|jgi:hypothetical protein|nr:hypothetical protein [Polyangiaceae bacterium]